MVNWISKNTFLEKILLPLGDFASRQSVMTQYNFYTAAQSWTFDYLLDYQNRKVKKLLDISVSSTVFYHDLYRDHGVDINKISSRYELEKLPIVTKDMLKSAYPDLCTIDTGLLWVELFTSGSSGAPFCVRQDYRTLSESRALMLMRATFSGWKIGEKFLQAGMTLRRGLVKKVKDWALGVHYVSAFDLSDTRLDSYLKIIEKQKISYIMGYAASLYCLAHRAKMLGTDIELKGVVSWGDNMYDHYRSEIEESFRCQVTDTYGCGEGIQVAAQCKLGKYHIFSPHVIVEFVDKYGRNVRKGELGDILLTRLTPGAMPLIRYRVGDIGVPGGNCICGCNFEVMESIQGRDTDIIYTSNGNKLIVHFFTGIFEYENSIKEFQVVQDVVGEIKIRIIPGKDFSTKTLSKIEHEIHQKGDMDLVVKFDIVDSIHVNKSNKRRFVVSNLK